MNLTAAINAASDLAVDMPITAYATVAGDAEYADDLASATKSGITDPNAAKSAGGTGTADLDIRLRSGAQSLDGAIFSSEDSPMSLSGAETSSDAEGRFFRSGSTTPRSVSPFFAGTGSGEVQNSIRKRAIMPTINLFSVNADAPGALVADAISNLSDQIDAALQSIVDAYCCRAATADKDHHHWVSMQVFALQSLVAQQRMLCGRLDALEVADTTEADLAAKDGYIDTLRSQLLSSSGCIARLLKKLKKKNKTIAQQRKLIERAGV